MMMMSGLLMRSEHSEIKAKTETRECKTEIETKKTVMRPRPKTTRPRRRPRPVQSSQLHVKVTQMVCFIFLLHRWGGW